jgi:hypothetical protein
MKFSTVRATVFAVALAASVPATVSGQEVREQPRAAENRVDNDVDFWLDRSVRTDWLVWTETARREHYINERDRVATNVR